MRRWTWHPSVLVAAFATTIAALLGCSYIDVVAAGASAEAGAVVPTDVDAGVQTGPADAHSAPGCVGTYCFDFEEPIESIEGVVIEQRSGTLTRDCTRARSGECSAAAALDEPGAVAYLALDAPPSRPVWFVRAYVWVPSGLAIDDVAIIHVGTRGGGAGVNVDLRDEERLELFAIESDQPSLSPVGVTRRDEWMCFLLEVEVSDSSGRAVLSVDETVILQETAIDTAPPNGVDFITVGIDWSSSSQAAGTLWFDDIVVGTERLGCD